MKYCRLRTSAQVVFNGKIMQLYKYSKKERLKLELKSQLRKLEKQQSKCKNIKGKSKKLFNRKYSTDKQIKQTGSLKI